MHPYGYLRWHVEKLEKFSESHARPPCMLLSLAVHGNTKYAGCAGVADHDAKSKDYYVVVRPRDPTSTSCTITPVCFCALAYLTTL